MLSEIKQTYLKEANNIKNWKSLDKNELANLYIKYENDNLKRNWYFSALILKYWNQIYYLYESSKSCRLDIDDFSSWLVEALHIAFKYRRWTNPEFAVYNDPNGPDKVINKCILTTRQRWYEYFNKFKRKQNHIAYSIEESIELHNDSADVLLKQDSIEEETNKYITLINDFFRMKKYATAIILDFICFQDAFLYKGNKYTGKFVNERLVSHFCSLDNEKYLDYIFSRYDVEDKKAFKKYCQEFKLKNTRAIKRFCNLEIDKIKNNKEILSYVNN